MLFIFLESRDGAFSMRLYYKMIRGSTVVSFPWKSIWRAMAPRRVLFFVWTAAWGRYRTHDNLIKRGFTLVSWCCMCRCSGETCAHLLLHCDIASRLWRAPLGFSGIARVGC